MSRVVRAAMAGAFVITAAVGIRAGVDEKLGKGVSLTEATPIKALYEAPDKFVGKTIRIDGTVTAVCQEMGCWMAIGDSATAEQVVRLKVDHEAGIVFPISAKGKSASAEGVFEKLEASDKEGNEAAAEQVSQTGNASDFGKRYQIKATGAILK